MHLLFTGVGQPFAPGLWVRRRFSRQPTPLQTECRWSPEALQPRKLPPIARRTPSMGWPWRAREGPPRRPRRRQRRSTPRAVASFVDASGLFPIRRGPPKRAGSTRSGRRESFEEPSQRSREATAKSACWARVLGERSVHHARAFRAARCALRAQKWDGPSGARRECNRPRTHRCAHLRGNRAPAPVPCIPAFRSRLPSLYAREEIGRAHV